MSIHICVYAVASHVVPVYALCVSAYGSRAGSELLFRPRLYSRSADVFALAIIVWECFSLEAPGPGYLRKHGFPDHDFSDFLYKGCRPDLMGCMCERLSAAVSKAWSADPSDRIAADALVEVIESVEVTDEPAEPCADIASCSAENTLAMDHTDNR